MPLIYAMEASAAPELRAVLDQNEIDKDQVDEVVAKIQHVGGVQQALEQANTAARRAVSHLELFANSPAKEALADLANQYM